MTQKTDGPSLLHTPRPDMQFISWKTCRRAKGGRAFYLVSLHQYAQYALPELISPSSGQESLYGPLGKRPEALPPRVPALLTSSPEEEIRLTGPTGQGVMMLLTCVYAHDVIMTVITTVRSCVNAGFVHHIVRYIHFQCSTSKLTSPLREDVLQ